MKKNNSYCSVPQCRSWAKTDPDVSFHTFPMAGKETVSYEGPLGLKLIDRHKAWVKVLRITRPVSKYMKVCSLHFKKEDFFPKRKDLLSKRFLKKNVVPSQKLPPKPVQRNTELKEKINKLTNPYTYAKIHKRAKNIVSIPDPQIKLTPLDLNPKLELENHHTYANIRKEISKEEDPLANNAELELKDDTCKNVNLLEPQIKLEPLDDCSEMEVAPLPLTFVSSTMPNVDVKIEETEMETEIPDPVKINLFFQQLYNRDVCLNLRNNWGIFYASDNEEHFLLLSQLTLQNKKPVMERHITLESNLSVHYFIGNNEISDLDNFPKFVQTQNEFEDVVDRFYLLKLCSGGPEIRCYNNINNTECCIMDHSTGLWRHLKCNYINDTNKASCLQCYSLYQMLKKSFLLKLCSTDSGLK